MIGWIGRLTKPRSVTPAGPFNSDASGPVPQQVSGHGSPEVLTISRIGIEQHIDAFVLDISPDEQKLLRPTAGLIDAR